MATNMGRPSTALWGWKATRCMPEKLPVGYGSILPEHNDTLEANQMELAGSGSGLGGY